MTTVPVRWDTESGLQALLAGLSLSPFPQSGRMCTLSPYG